jgi:small subunit ribosomal protein S16
VLRIRLRRAGKKKQPFYRLVVADSRAPRDGAFIETIGTYNPLTNPATITVDAEAAKKWIGQGAIPSDRATLILASQGVVEAPVLPSRPKKAKEEPVAAVAPAPAPAAAAPAPEAAAPEADPTPETAE